MTERSRRSRAPLALVALTLAALLAAAPLASTPAAAQEGDVFTPRHVAKIQTVASAVMSPDGSTIAYTVAVPRDPMEEDNGGSWVELWVTDTEGNEKPFITGEQNVSTVRFTPDGKALTFRAKRGDDKYTAVWKIALDGGEAEKIASHDSSIAEYWLSPDGTKVAFLAKEKEPKARKKWKDKGFDPLVYEENHLFTRIWIHRIGSEDEPRLLDEVEGNASGLSWSPNGKHLVVAIAPTPLVDDSYMKKRVRLVDVDSGEVVRAIDNPGKLGKVRFSPDGKHLAMISAADPNDPNEARLMVIPVEGGSLTDVLPSFTDKDVMDFAWQTNDTLMFVAHEGVWSFFAEVKADGSDYKQILPMEGPILSSVSLNSAGTAAAFTADSPTHSREVFTMSHGDQKPSRLTDVNPWMQGMRLAKQEVVTYTARDGLEIHGLLIRPLDEQPGKSYPLILTVHGGPEAHYSNGWLTRYSYAGQLGAAEGYAVFYPNYRGSTGRGVAFSKMGHADAAGKEFDDLVDGVDYLIDTGLADRDRVGITGGSYGGYASAWGATRYSDRYAASVMFVGISNNISKTGTTDIPVEMYDVHHLKWLWEDWDYFLQRSPIYHIEKARTPILIMHGKEDPRVHPSQSMELYRHLKVRGETPVRLVFYPGEGHGNRKAAGRIDYNLRMMRWFDHYLKGDGDRRTKTPPPADIDYESKLGALTE